MSRASLVAGLAIVLSLVAAPSHASDGFRVSSPSFVAGKPIPATKFVFDRFGCGGANISPGLSWSGAPEGARSYAVTLFDPDARGGKGWWHWLVFDIPPTRTSLAEGGLVPKGAMEGTSDFGVPGYQGPCPPKGSGAHHYVFTVYALDVETLALGPNVKGAPALEVLRRHSLGAATVQFLYGRP
ncbi:YbhB/YbcL family Raf kinase inhibitor-like protein [Parvibaculum sp.]|uniref:YbhB/YbcL family Raf kinase inhibitor-like protein n=1 Tax=Parvibaculum sp. TaxID=2024848 RepID=UPI00320C3E59